MLKGEPVIYIDLKGEEIAAQVVSSRDVPVIRVEKLGIVGAVSDNVLLAVKATIEDNLEGQQISVASSHGVIRGSFTVKKMEAVDGGICIEADTLPAGTTDGDLLHQSLIVHNKPLLTLQHPGSVPGQPVTLYDIMHHTHPAKQENNPNLPSVILHAWKRPGEGHVAPAKDHPVHDQPFRTPQTDERGTIIPVSRPHHEAHVLEHQASKIESPEERQAFVSAAAVTTPKAPAAQKVKLSQLPDPTEHHPGNPETVTYRTKCTLCQADIIRTSHHQGGREFDAQPVKDGDVDTWVLHSTTCKGIPPQPPTLEELAAAVQTEAPEEHPLQALVNKGGALTQEDLAKHFPVVSVLYDNGDAETYRGVLATLPGGHSHTVKANGFEQDFKDALQFCHVNGFTTHVEDPTVAQFNTDFAKWRSAYEVELKERQVEREKAAALLKLIRSFPVGAHLRVSLVAMRRLIEANSAPQSGPLNIEGRTVVADPTITHDETVLTKEPDVIEQLERDTKGAPAEEQPPAEATGDQA